MHLSLRVNTKEEIKKKRTRHTHKGGKKKKRGEDTWKTHSRAKRRGRRGSQKQCKNTEGDLAPRSGGRDETPREGGKGRKSPVGRPMATPRVI